jgi:hypothetical protein
MLPHTQPRKKRNSSRVNLLISFTFHAILVLTLLYFAARQGLLGKQLKKISINMVKEKPPEKAQGTRKAQGRAAEGRRNTEAGRSAKAR